MKQYFCCSDIHSFFSSWQEALTSAGFDINNDEHNIIICGDLFDRGEESVNCYEFIKEMSSKNRLVYIRGNHEDLLEELVWDIRKMRHIEGHHVSNGTVDTIAEFIGCSSYDILCRSFDWNVFEERMTELLSFINDNSVDYFQLGNTVFVHGWVPTTFDEEERLIVHANWRDGDWKEARWPNGMEMFHSKIVPSDVTTVVCGHWHTSFAWHHYEDVCPEWGNLAKFDAYIKSDETNKSKIIALDACTVYSNKVNCVVFNETGEEVL